MANFFGLEIHNIENYNKSRKKTIKFKTDAIDTHFSELNGIINISVFAKRFFGKSQSWFSQKLHGCLIIDKKMQFKEKECKEIAEGFRELARQLNQYADEIDRAEMD